MAHLVLVGGTPFDPKPLLKGYEIQPNGAVIVPLSGTHLVGRGLHCDVVFDTARMSREHDLFEHTDEGWRITHVGSNLGFGVNENHRMARSLLVHGDRVRIGLFFFDFIDESKGAQSQAREDRRRAIEEQLSQSLDDEAAWAVYTDMLIEAGDPLAQRLSAQDDARWLGGLAKAVKERALELTFTHGMIRTARVAAHQGHRLTVLTELLNQPIGRFLERLEVSVLPRGPGIGLLMPIAAPQFVLETVAATLRQRRRAALRHVHFYPPINAHFLPTPNSLELGDVAPRFTQADGSGRVSAWSEVFLEGLDGKRYPLSSTLAPRHPLHGQVRFELGITWALASMTTGLSFNGRPLPEGGAWLLEGDRVEAIDGQTFTVRVEA